jgi:hypothetical protein
MYENVAFPPLILRKPASFIVHQKGGQNGAAAQLHFFGGGLNCGTVLFFGLNHGTCFCDQNKRSENRVILLFEGKNIDRNFCFSPPVIDFVLAKRVVWGYVMVAFLEKNWKYRTSIQVSVFASELVVWGYVIAIETRV